MEWIDASEQDPPPSSSATSYLVILISKARSQHAKRFAGLGTAEIATWCSGWSSGWNARGSLSVAYWRPLPDFNYKWNDGGSGNEPFWEPPNSNVSDTIT